mgnify:FL=1
MFEKKLTGYASIDKPQNKGAKFFEAHPIIPDINIYTAIKVISSFYRDEKAVDCLKLSATYQQLLDDAVTVSMALKELGVRKEDIITVSMPNFYQAVAVFMAANRIGATTTFLNSFAPDEEIVSYLNLFESPVYINFNRSDEENQKIVDKTHVRYVITLDKSKVNSLSLNGNYHLTKSNTIDFNTLGCLAKFQKKTLENPFNALDDALILYTSGTTGKPKAVVLTNKNILAAATYLKNSTHISDTRGEKSLVCVPFTYPYGFSTSTLMSLMCGRTAILAPDLSKDNLYYYLAKNPNIIFGSPALLELMMINAPKDFDLSSIKTFISGGDFLTPANAKRGEDFFQEHKAKTVITNGSGNAETVSCGTNSVGIEVKPETVGRVLTGSDCLVIDMDKYNNNRTIEEKKIGEEGLLLIGGEHVFKEYYKKPELTKKAKIVVNGKNYVATGMFGRLDNDGYFTLTGRQSRFYIISTLNKVYLDYVQGVISNFPCVKDCAVVKVDTNDGSLAANKAYIVLDKSKMLDNKDFTSQILDLCLKPIKMVNGDVVQLKEYEIPAYIEFVNALPRRKGTEKVDYQLLEQKAADDLKKGESQKFYKLELAK